MDVQEQHKTKVLLWVTAHRVLETLPTLSTFLFSETPYKHISLQNTYTAELTPFVYTHTHAQEAATAFPFKKTSVIGSNSTESFPGHQVAGKHSARN